MKEKRSNQLDFLYGLVVVLLSLIFWFWMIPTQIKTRKAYFNDAAMIPRFAVIILAGMGVLLMANSCRKAGGIKAICDVKGVRFNGKDFGKRLLFIAFTLVYIRLMPVAGFVLATIPFSFVLLCWFGSRPIGKNAIIAVAFSLIAYLLFLYAFRVNLPRGPLWF